MKYILKFIILLSSVTSLAQTIQGRVTTPESEPLVGATIRLMGTSQGAVTDVSGKFSVPAEVGDYLVVNFIGFETDTVLVTGAYMDVALAESAEQLGEVVIESESTFFDELEPIHNEIILESELTKAACCNLSESFETNASVDVSFSDAVSGAKVIRMLGLDGRYVQINRENIPLVRGLSGRYGLGFVPGTWIQTIDVGKGAGSVVNGYESMSGQINVEFKKPESSEPLYLNAYVNSFGRHELNFNKATKLKNNWSMGWLVHVDNLTSEIDRNDDGFLDLPKSRQVNVMNRYKYDGARLKSQIGVNFTRDEKAGGQQGFGFGENHQTFSGYGFSNNTTRLEVFGKTGLLYPRTPYQGWGLIYSASIQQIDAGFGRNEYEGTEKTLYFNGIYQNIIGNSFHQYKTGASMLVDAFEEQYVDWAFDRQEIVPGVFFEYSYLPGTRLSVVLGQRLDFHNLYGTLYTPRAHLRYELTPGLTVRGAVGKGFRTPNVVSENSRFLVSSRTLVVLESIDPEESWNMGGSLVAQIPIANKKLQLVGDYFYTRFVNQMVVDQDASSSQVRIYNLDGSSYAHSVQIEGSMKVNEFVDVKAAYKLYDVRTTMADRLRQVPYVSRDRIFFNIAYATKYDKWKADATVQWIGRKRLPITSDKPLEFQQSGFSQDYALVNGQVVRGFRWGSIYLGAENLFDFRQETPVIDAENPFGDDFDASIVWGPVAGRVVYAGFRYKIKNN